MLDLTMYGLPGSINLNKRGKIPVANSPVFTSQPDSLSYFQQGGKLEIKSASVTGYSSLTWQKKNADGSWSDTTGKSIVYTIPSGSAADDGTYRLMAVNGNSLPAYSNEVVAQDTVLYLQNDNDNAGTGASAVKRDAIDPTKYTMLTVPASTTTSIPISGFLRKRANVSSATNQGVANGIAGLSSDSAVVQVGTTSGRTVRIVALKPGKATLTTTWNNLKSTVEITPV